MSVSSWFSSTLSRSRALRGQRRTSAPRRKKARLFLEHLEVRALLSSYTAPTVSALIADIDAANTAGGANTISLTAPTTSPYLFTASNNGTNGGNFLPVIAASDNLTIVGNGDTLQPGPRHAYARFFDVSAGASLTLQNLTLQDDELLYSSWLSGGAISNQGALTLSGVTVQKNVVEPNNGSAMGGGIWSNGSLTLENGTLFEDNTVTGANGGYDGFGGAVYIAGGSANISNTTFTGNVATGGDGPERFDDGSGLGGAFYVAIGQVVMTTSTVENNEATVASNAGGTSYGGGVYVAGGPVTLSMTLSKDTVESNSASSAGGGICYIASWAGGTMTLSNDTVESNSASSGGGLYVAGGTMTLSNDTVESNSASSGGGLYVAGGTMTLSNDTVESNSASSAGGGIYIDSSATVYVDPFTLAHVINNTASTDPNIDGTYILT